MQLLYIYIYIFVNVGSKFSFKHVLLKTIATLALANFNLILIPNEDCMLQNINYIGSTTTTLSRRLTMHLNNGAINDHTLSVHRSSLSRANIVDNTKVLCRQRDTFRLLVYEASFIKLRYLTHTKILKLNAEN